jgi:hypothetical protein
MKYRGLRVIVRILESLGLVALCIFLALTVSLVVVRDLGPYGLGGLGWLVLIFFGAIGGAIGLFYLAGILKLLIDIAGNAGSSERS